MPVRRAWAARGSRGCRVVAAGVVCVCVCVPRLPCLCPERARRDGCFGTCYVELVLFWCAGWSRVGGWVGGEGVGGMNGAALRATGWATVCTDYCVCAVVCRLRVLSVDVPCVVVAQAYVCTALSDHGPNCPCIAALVINWYYGSGGAWVLSWADTRLCVALLACADDVIAFPPGIVVLVFSRAGCCIPVCATHPPPLWPLVGLHGRPLAHVAKWL